jgi:hypothetical protein
VPHLSGSYVCTDLATEGSEIPSSRIVDRLK